MIHCQASNCRWNPYSSLSQVQNIIVQNQEFGLSESEPTSPFYYASFDGILGMAYPAMSMGGYTVMQQMLRQGQLSESIFSFYFSRYDSALHIFVLGYILSM